MASFIDLTNHLALGRGARIHANFTRRSTADFADLDGNTNSIDIDAIAPASSEVLESRGSPQRWRDT